MPRKVVPVSSDHPYHITARSNNRDWFAAPMEVVWRIMSDYLFFISHGFHVEVLSFVLMENHFHLYARFPSGELAESMQYFMRETSRSIAKASGRINHVYGRPFFRSLIKDQNSLLCVYRYVYRNPIEAKTAARAESYRYSTLSGLLGQQPLIIPVVQDEILFGGPVERTLEWLNAPLEADWHRTVRNALRSEQFEMPILRTTRRPISFGFDSQI